LCLGGGAIDRVFFEGREEWLKGGREGGGRKRGSVKESFYKSRPGGRQVGWQARD
jgi:hypothetical protein